MSVCIADGERDSLCENLVVEKGEVKMGECL